MPAKNQNISVFNNEVPPPQRALLVHCGGANDWQKAEFRGLATAANLEIASEESVNQQVVKSKYYVGSGKAQEIASLVTALDVQVVLFNIPLSAIQERNLEKLFNAKVVDRVRLILDIFASRARTHEGKLQVELAQLVHQSTRLIRGWTHLERQKGGIGLRGGPGETQLETDRRLIRGRIVAIKRQLAEVRNQRSQGRKARQKKQLPTVALVGYTNAGKSTLFNTLTGAEVFAQDILFATLDPTLRAIECKPVGKVIMADTVGFVSDLPHQLVDAFRATLEEVSDATLLLHVIDRSSPGWRTQAEEVEKVLEQIGALEIPRIEVYNKVDELADILPHVDRLGNLKRVWVSAKTGAGLELVQELIAENLSGEFVRVELELPPEEQQLRAALFAEGLVQSEHYDDTVRLVLVAPRSKWDILVRQHPILMSALLHDEKDT